MKRFELTIIIGLALKYTYITYLTIAFDSNNDSALFLFLALGIIAHWMFASQYLKTSLLTPDIIKEANLRKERHSIRKDESEIS